MIWHGQFVLIFSLKGGTFEIGLLLCTKINNKAGNNTFQHLINAPRKLEKKDISQLQVEEVQRALGKLKKNKATDSMGLTNEHLKLRGLPLEIYRGCNIRVFVVICFQIFKSNRKAMNMNWSFKLLFLL